MTDTRRLPTETEAFQQSVINDLRAETAKMQAEIDRLRAAMVAKAEHWRKLSNLNASTQGGDSLNMQRSIQYRMMADELDELLTLAGKG